MQRVTPTPNDVAYDPQTTEFYMGDVTPCNLATQYQTEQTSLHDRFTRTLNDVLPTGYRVDGVRALYSSWRFTVRHTSSAPYAHDVRAKFPNASVTLGPEADVWIVPYEAKGGPLVWPYVFMILATLAVLYALLLIEPRPLK